MKEIVELKKDSYDSLLACYRSLRNLAGYLYVHRMLLPEMVEQMEKVRVGVEGADDDLQRSDDSPVAW